MISCADVFRDLASPSAGGEMVFEAGVIPGWGRFRVGRDNRDRPALLIDPAPDSSQRQQSNVELLHISYWSSATCEVTAGGEKTTGSFAVIRCKSEERELRTLFLHVLDSWIHALGHDPSRDQIGRGVDRLVQLFQNLSGPTREEVKGLWGELLVITASSDPDVLVRAWHGRPRDVYDFSDGEQMIEVKTASGRRVHGFSLHQLHPPAETSLIVASVLVDESTSGASIRDLCSAISARLDEPALRFRVDEVVAATLGLEWARATTDRFSVHDALKGLRWYEASRLPTIDEDDVPPEISDVRFRVDLSGSPAADAHVLAQRGGLVAAAVHYDDPSDQKQR